MCTQGKAAFLLLLCLSGLICLSLGCAGVNPAASRGGSYDSQPGDSQSNAFWMAPEGRWFHSQGGCKGPLWICALDKERRKLQSQREGLIKSCRVFLDTSSSCPGEDLHRGVAAGT